MLREHLKSLLSTLKETASTVLLRLRDERDEKTLTVKLDPSPGVHIICGDCGRQVTYNNRCPICGTKYWEPVVKTSSTIPLPPALPKFFKKGENF